MSKLIKPAAMSLVTVFWLNLVSGIALSASQAQENGYLLLRTTTEGLTVAIDGEFVGFTPTPPLAMPPGEHEVVVTHPNRKNWLDMDWRTRITVAEGDTVVREVVFERSYAIRSQPYGAEVYKADQKVGTTPVFVSIPDEGFEEITLTRPGYRDTTFIVGLTRQNAFDVTMQPESEQPALVLQGDLETPKKKRSNMPIYLSAGASLASALLSLYLRSKANDSFDRYLQFGDPAVFNKHLDDAKRFDRYSGVAFAGFQISFAASLYFFFKRVD